MSATGASTAAWADLDMAGEIGYLSGYGGARMSVSRVGTNALRAGAGWVRVLSVASVLVSGCTALLPEDDTCLVADACREEPDPRWDCIADEAAPTDTRLQVPQHPCSSTR
jgi:hypothetical protein